MVTNTNVLTKEESMFIRKEDLLKIEKMAEETLATGKLSIFESKPLHDIINIVSHCFMEGLRDDGDDDIHMSDFKVSRR